MVPAPLPNSINGWHRMRVPLKGLYLCPKRLADGRVKVYAYAWRGGPRLAGEPGSPEFIASFNEAVARRAAPTTGTLKSVLAAYEADEQTFGKLAERSKKYYRGKLKLISQSFADFPLGALSDPRTRGIFKSWRNDLAKKSKRQADYPWSVLSAVLSFGVDNRLIDTNPCLKGGRLYDGSRVDKVWTYDDESAFDDRPKHLLLPLMLAIWTARRQGDLLYLQWSAYDGTFIRLRQRKTGKRVTIPVGGPLKLALDAEKTNRRNDGKSVVLTILMNSMGRPWTADGFRTSWRKACQKAGVTGLTFHDLRGSAITRLALAGATVPEIANSSGLSLGDVPGILDKHYQNDDVQLGQSAIRKLEALKDSKG